MNHEDFRNGVGLGIFLVMMIEILLAVGFLIGYNL